MRDCWYVHIAGLLVGKVDYLFFYANLLNFLAGFIYVDGMQEIKNKNNVAREEGNYIIKHFMCIYEEKKNCKKKSAAQPIAKHYA